MCNNFRHPALLAKEVVTLAHLSGGRFEFGLGAGYNAAGYHLTRKISHLLPRLLPANNAAECTDTKSQ
jgi:alkanesulfonate monooxygenase SsuD/methylene tetrahydromethanopterin reductase-like flavin-dependent oxidoreductase (luciferase family)